MRTRIASLAIAFSLLTISTFVPYARASTTTSTTESCTNMPTEPNEVLTGTVTWRFVYTLGDGLNIIFVCHSDGRGRTGDTSSTTDPLVSWTLSITLMTKNHKIVAANSTSGTSSMGGLTVQAPDGATVTASFVATNS